MQYRIEITLLSDTTFGCGDGVAGSVDTEIDYDSKTGLPFLRGRTLRGLLVEECANILYALSLQNCPNQQLLEQAAEKLFGRPGSRIEDEGALRVGAAEFPDDLRAVIRKEVEDGSLTPADVLDLLTAVRRQTAMDENTDAPLKNSLRSQRALIRQTRLIATLEMREKPDDLYLALLAASVRSLRRGGSGRNRGRGRLSCVLKDAEGHEVISTDALSARLYKEGAITE